jgi:lipoprotein-anchoring transpeptidase ErfK/SrfK
MVTRKQRRGRTWIGILVLVAAAVIVVTRVADDERRDTATPSVPLSVSTTARPSPTPVDPDQTFIATAAVNSVAVYTDPAAPTPTMSFPNPWFVNDDPRAAVALVFAVEAQRPDGWLKVLLPIRPNGSTGWIRATDVTLTPTRYRVTVELAARRLRVTNGPQVILENTVAVGAPDTPTPAGRYYIRALLRAPNPNTVYGPYAYGLSGHSDSLQTFNGGDAEVGIHGNNDPSVLGRAITHGCIRMSNAAITTLTNVLPLGTPVTIRP